MTDPTNETTVQQPPVSAAEHAAAQAELAEGRAWLNGHTKDQGDPDLVRWINRVSAATTTIRRAADEAKARQTAPPMTPEQRIAALVAHRETLQMLKDEPEGGGPMSDALRDRLIEQSAALHAGDHVPGTYTDADLRGVTREAGLTDEGHALFGAALDRLGVSAGAERMRLGFALRDAVPEDEGALTEEVMAARVAEWWGDGPEADAKLAAADRTWLALTRTERLALNPRRGARVFMEAMVQLGQALGRR